MTRVSLLSADVGIMKWKPATSFKAGQYVVNPFGDVVSAKADHVSGATYTESNWSSYGKDTYAAKVGPALLSAPTSATITARLNTLPASGGFLVLDEGEYTIDQKIDVGARPNVQIIGQGRGTILRAADGLNDTVLSVGDSTLSELTSGFSLAHVSIDGNQAGQTATVPVGSVQVGGPYGLMLWATDDLRLHDVEIHDCYDSGLRHQGVPSPGDYTRKAWMTQLSIHHNRNNGMELSQRFRQIALHGVACDYNGGTGLYADHSEADYQGVIARHNGGRGIYIHNVQRCVYHGLHAYNNGGNGIYVVGLVDSVGSDWIAHNNNRNAAANGSDVFFDERDLGYGITRNSQITGVKTGALNNDSVSSENGTTEEYGIYFQDGMSAATDLVLSDVTTGLATVGEVRLPTAYAPGITLRPAKRVRPRPGRRLTSGGYETLGLQDADSGALAPGSGAGMFAVVEADTWMRTTQVLIPSGTTAASGLTLARAALCSYDATTGTLSAPLATTANDTTLFAAANTPYTKTWNTPVTLSPGKCYAIVVLQVGTTPAKLAGRVGISALSGASAQLPRTGGAITGLADLPTTATLDSAVTTKTEQIYAVLLP